MEVCRRLAVDVATTNNQTCFARRLFVFFQANDRSYSKKNAGEVGQPVFSLTEHLRGSSFERRARMPAGEVKSSRVTWRVTFVQKKNKNQRANKVKKLQDTV